MVQVLLVAGVVQVDLLVKTEDMAKTGIMVEMEIMVMILKYMLIVIKIQ